MSTPYIYAMRHKDGKSDFITSSSDGYPGSVLNSLFMFMGKNSKVNAWEAIGEIFRNKSSVSANPIPFLMPRHIGNRDRVTQVDEETGLKILEVIVSPEDFGKISNGHNYILDLYQKTGYIDDRWEGCAGFLRRIYLDRYPKFKLVYKSTNGDELPFIVDAHGTRLDSNIVQFANVAAGYTTWRLEGFPEECEGTQVYHDKPDAYCGLVVVVDEDTPDVFKFGVNINGQIKIVMEVEPQPIELMTKEGRDSLLKQLNDSYYDE